MSPDNTSRIYEAVFIYRIGEGSLSQGKTHVTTEFQNIGLKVLNENDMGERSLAYEIKKNDRGHYIRYDVEASPDMIQQAERALKLKPEILKYIFFRKEK